MFRKSMLALLVGALVGTAVQAVPATTRPKSKSKSIKSQSKTEKNVTLVEVEYWNSIRNSQNPKDFEAYLADYPKGHFKRLAQNKLEEFAPTPPRAVVVAPPARNEELDYWNSIKASNDPETFRTFLHKYPDGMCAVLAKSRLKKLTEKPASSAVIRTIPASKSK